MVKRPVGIHASYINDEGDEIEERIYDFKARMFLHELDHLNGRSMTHWSLSEGNIEIFKGSQDNYPNLASVLSLFYLIDSSLLQNINRRT